MATTPRPGLPYIWCTWLTKQLAGETACLYQPWLKSHFRYDKRPNSNFNLAAWTHDHSALVTARSAELIADGWRVTLEQENAFTFRGKTAVLAGQPDLVAVREGVGLVVDGKTGQQRHSDFWQVLIYMLVLPRVRPELPALRGEVTYQDQRIAIEPEELTASIADQIYALVRTLGESTRPPTTPSRKDCGWCDIAECHDRFVDRESAVLASEF